MIVHGLGRVAKTESSTNPRPRLTVELDPHKTPNTTPQFSNMIMDTMSLLLIWMIWIWLAFSSILKTGASKETTYCKKKSNVEERIVACRRMRRNDGSICVNDLTNNLVHRIDTVVLGRLACDAHSCSRDSPSRVVENRGAPPNKNTTHACATNNLQAPLIQLHFPHGLFLHSHKTSMIPSLYDIHASPLQFVQFTVRIGMVLTLRRCQWYG